MKKFEKGKTYYGMERNIRVYAKVVATTVKTVTFKILGTQNNVDSYSPYQIDEVIVDRNQKRNIYFDARNESEYSEVSAYIKNKWDDGKTYCTGIVIRAKDEVELDTAAEEVVETESVDTAAAEVVEAESEENVETAAEVVETIEEVTADTAAVEVAGESKFLVNVYTQRIEPDRIWRGMESATVTGTQAAAQFVIDFAKQNPDRSVTEFYIKKFGKPEEYRSTKADIAAIDALIDPVGHHIYEQYKALCKWVYNYIDENNVTTEQAQDVLVELITGAIRTEQAAVEVVEVYKPQTSWENPHNYESEGCTDTDRYLAARYHFTNDVETQRVIDEAGCEAEDYDETDEPEILNADIWVNINSSPKQEKSGYAFIKVGTDNLFFEGVKLVSVLNDAYDLRLSFTPSGRKQFRHKGSIISAKKVAEIYMNQLATDEVARAKLKTHDWNAFCAATANTGVEEVTDKLEDKVSKRVEKVLARIGVKLSDVEVTTVKRKPFITKKANSVYEAVEILGKFFPDAVYKFDDENVEDDGKTVRRLFTAIAGGYYYVLVETVTNGKLSKAIFTDGCYNVRVILTFDNTPEQEVATQNVEEPEPAPTEPFFESFAFKRDALITQRAIAATKLKEAEKAFKAARAAAHDAQYKFYDFMTDNMHRLNEKFFPLPDAEIEVKTMEGNLAFINAESVYVDFDATKFILRGDCSELNGLTLGTYDTPEQVERAVEQFKAAIERSDKKFNFTVAVDIGDEKTVEGSIVDIAEFTPLRRHRKKLSLRNLRENARAI